MWILLGQKMMILFWGVLNGIYNGANEVTSMLIRLCQFFIFFGILSSISISTVFF